jgi:hypothetical protein
MKKTIVVLFLAFLFSNLSNAQIYKGFGVKVGTSIANQETEVFGSFLRYKFGFTAGIFKETPIFEKLNLIVGINYTQKGALEPMYVTSEEGQYIETKYFHRTVNMATLELLTKYEGNKEKLSPYILAGLRMDIFISAKNTYDGNELLRSEYSYPINNNKTFGGVIGMGLDFRPTKSLTAFIEGTYNPDFTLLGERYINKSNDSWKIRNYSFDIRTGIKF